MSVSMIDRKSGQTGKKYTTGSASSRNRYQDYSLRLSWPRPNDGRRAVVLNRVHSVSPTNSAVQISNARFIHLSSWDIELYQSLKSPLSKPQQSIPSLHVPKTSWNPSEIEEVDRDMIEYFCQVASGSLATFGHDTTALGHTLVRIALQGNSAASKAVIQALLAFASLHRYGLQAQALELKIAALGSLSTGSETASFGSEATLEHIATGMLLCSFELHQSSWTTGQWMSYLNGVRMVLHASSLEEMSTASPDAAILLDWVHYHDVLARFSLLYWRREDITGLQSPPIDISALEMSSLPPLHSSLLSLLAQVCDAVHDGGGLSSTSTGNLDDYRSFIQVLDWRIRSLPLVEAHNAEQDLDEEALTAQLYQLATLIFLNRNFEDQINKPARTQQHIDKAFSILAKLSFCKQQFPLHVIGCEARTDEQRATVLDLIDSTERLHSSRSLSYTKRIIEACWAQDDLSNGVDTSYSDRLTTILSQCQIVPSFV